ncbi:autotransporter outer membrane beta-barrel domain-containing protein [Pseudomonas cichorii]|nr:autotransporter outer membrane beta-barrel domain-containing protein [Pseudomonas cichorii]MBX8550646.1 autotransporter outer membrane beta-barrel domain-containing protein [Pseudomonas cichorii]MBX8586485.1 autotransporter outer membrane beta-barrel domain-containing protein [Pseudomonas cichorii]MBX8601467.1 autotransporter outer membrane beta-barrel domain-containing protein [Pseudomonas cichorii]
MTNHVTSAHSTLFINNGTVNNETPNAGIDVYDSRVILEHATVRSMGNGILLGISTGTAKPGTWASMSDSDISGFGFGIGLSQLSRLEMSNTKVYGALSADGRYGEGLLLSGGDAVITGASHIRGDRNGIRIIEGVFIPGNDNAGVTSTAVIDHSIIEGINGAAIRIDKSDQFGAIVDIAVQNGSTLLSGNGNLLEVADRSTANFKVDNSNLAGNLIADDTSTLNVTLQNYAQLTGDIINGNSLAVDSGAHWQMVGDNSIQSLSMDGGHVSFGEDGFHTLSLGELSGKGSFGMRVDLDNGVGDLLNVNGQANGEFGLRVQNTGVEVVSPDMEPLKVVHTEGGNAQFSLIGGRVDLGTYSYLLEQQGNDWFIVGNDKTISPSTSAALALFNAAPVIWMSELSTLRSRMGEVRASGQGGGWMRAYGNRFNATTSDGVEYRHKHQGLSLGADAPIEVGHGQLLLGVMGGYSTSDLDLDRGTTGKVSSYYVGAYGTWLLDDGYYLDGVLKFNSFRNKSDVAMSDASKAKGDYTNTGVGASVEFGRHIALADDYFLEPFAQLASVVIQGDRYRMDNGLQAKNGDTQSILGKVGSSVGRNIALKDGGVLQPYLRVAVAQEFSRSNDVKVNDSRFDNNLFGSRAELGAGVSVSLSERLQLHADFDYMKGKRVEQPWGANVGLRLAF